MTIEIGQKAPDFTLQNQHGEDVSLTGLRGTPVALVFFPFAFSPICTGELCELRDNPGAFRENGVELFAVSCDHMFTLRAYAESDGYDFGLLSDFWPHGEVSKAYGIFDEDRGCSLRGTYLIDPDGVLRWKVERQIGEPRDLLDYREAVAQLAA